MPTETTRTGRARATADDPKAGMTLDELEAFVQAARKAEIPGDTIPKMTATWRGTIKKLNAEG